MPSQTEKNLIEIMHEFETKHNEKMEQVSIKMATMEGNIKNIKENTDRIENKIDDFISCADEKYASRESFIFWRGILVGGIFLSIFLGILTLFIDKIIN